jgi:hypothetical protein
VTCPECDGIGSVIDSPSGRGCDPRGEETECLTCEGCGRLCDDCGDPIPVSVQRMEPKQTVCAECRSEREAAEIAEHEEADRQDARNDPDTIADERYHFEKENP